MMSIKKIIVVKKMSKVVSDVTTDMNTTRDNNISRLNPSLEKVCILIKTLC